MTPQDFTPDGVQALLEELYALSASDLAEQVSLIESDFASWIADNFNLSDDQQTYLDGMDSQFLSYAANLTGFAVANQLSIALTVDPTSTPFKLIHVSDDIECVNTASDGLTVTGGITYYVQYAES